MALEQSKYYYEQNIHNIDILHCNTIDQCYFSPKQLHKSYPTKIVKSILNSAVGVCICMWWIEYLFPQSVSLYLASSPFQLHALWMGLPHWGVKVLKDSQEQLLSLPNVIVVPITTPQNEANSCTVSETYIQHGLPFQPICSLSQISSSIFWCIPTSCFIFLFSLSYKGSFDKFFYSHTWATVDGHDVAVEIVWKELIIG